jgi:DNA-binding SARP family transcriptional activator
MVASLLLPEKIRRPTPFGLCRARLEDPLVRVDGPGLTLVCAPAGSGKSTLLARVAAAAELPVSWYRVTADDAAGDTLTSHLAVALHIARTAERGGPTPAWEIEDLVAAAQAADTPRLLFVDDLHEIAGTRAERMFETFVALRPQSLRLILASRRTPEFNLSLLRAAGAIHEITSDDLRFRVWEVEELFTLVHREPLSPETAAALTRRTAGWAAGLQLFHLANTRKTASARQQAVSSLGPRARLIRSYLTRNVLDELPDDRRSFLVLTSALGLLTGQLCDALLGTTDSAVVLEELERDQLFTSSVDDGLTYRYHEVLQRHLEMTLLQEQGAATAREWYARCAALLEVAGAHGDALRAYAMAEDWAAITRLVQRIATDGTTAIAIEPAQLLPPTLVRSDPWLALADARRRLRHGAIAAAVAGFEHAATLLDEPRFREICAAERRAAQVWLPLAAEVPDASDPTSAWSARIRATTRAATPPRSGARRQPDRTGQVSRDGVVGGVGALVAGQFETAAARFAEVAATTTGIDLARLGALLGGVVADAALGRSSDYAARLEEITLDADAGGYPWMSRLARGVLAAILAVSDNAPWRLDAFSELLTECDRAGDAWGAALLQLACAVAGGLIGHVAAPDRFADAERRLTELDATCLAGWARTLAARVSGGGGEKPPPARIRVVCFGGFEIVVDGQPADLHELRPRALALLRLLAIHHDTHVHRERLIEMLWPGAALDVGLRRLQVAISSVRNVLHRSGVTDLDAVRRLGDSYRLTIRDATVDVSRFEELLTAARRERGNESRRIALHSEALDLYVGDLLPEDGSAEYIDTERERLRIAAADAACSLARDHAARADLDAAVAAARRSLRLDRYQDLAWGLLADCLAAIGDDTAATRTRLEHSRVRALLEGEPVVPARSSSRTPRAGVERPLSGR